MEIDTALHKAAKLHAVRTGSTLRGLYERALREFLQREGAVPQAEASRAELLAVAEEIGLDRALAALRAATRAKAGERAA